MKSAERHLIVRNSGSIVRPRQEVFARALDGTRCSIAAERALRSDRSTCLSVAG